MDHGQPVLASNSRFALPRIVACAQYLAAVLHPLSCHVLAKGAAYNTIYFQYRSKVTALNSHIGSS